MKGIYKIENNRSNRVYIGQSVNLKDRFQSHTSRLIKGKHDNPQLQEDFNRGDDFIFTVIEFTDNLNEREGFWMNQYESLYNISGNREVEDRNCDLEVGVDYPIRKRLALYSKGFRFEKFVKQLREGTISDLDRIKLFEKYPWLKEAIEYLGFSRIGHLSFCQGRIQKELKLAKRKTKRRDYILKSMKVEVGDFWNGPELDAKLQCIYNQLNLGEVNRFEKKKYYRFKNTTRTINGKRISGLLITKIL